MKKHTILKILLNAFFVILALIILLPMAWMILNSLKTNQELFRDSLALPAVPQFKNWVNAWNQGLYKYFGNSLIVSGSSLIGILIFSSFLAYGLTRFKAKGSGIIFLVVLGGMALSEQVALVPLYKMLKAVHLYNTYWAVILPYIAFRIPFTVFLMRSYFISIPKELEEAAVVDGYNSLQIFTKIILPITKPALAVVGMFAFLNSWNDFLNPLVYLNSEKKYTVALGLQLFTGSYRGEWNLMMAAACLVLAPVVVVFAIGQKYLIEGVTMSGVKG